MIPCYNSKSTILRTLQSLYLQTYKNFEIILVDDCSSDATIDLAKSYSEKFNYVGVVLKIINLPVNSGVSRARNIGLSQARGKYIAFLDSDDIFHPNRLTIMHELLLSNLNHNFIFNFYTHNHRQIYNNSQNIIFKFKKLSFFRLILKNPIQTSTVIVARDVIEPFDETMTHCEDYALWLKIALSNNLYCLPLYLTGLGRPQLTPGGLSGNKRAMHHGELMAYRTTLRLIRCEFLYPLLFIYSKFKFFKKLITPTF